MNNKYRGPVNVMLAWDGADQTYVAGGEGHIVHGGQTKSIQFDTSNIGGVDQSYAAGGKWSVVVRPCDDPNSDRILYSRSYDVANNAVSIKVPFWSGTDVAAYVLGTLLSIIFIVILFWLLYMLIVSAFARPKDAGVVPGGAATI